MSRTVYYDMNGNDVTDEVMDSTLKDWDHVRVDEEIEDTKMHNRSTILSEAERVITKDRQDQYGNAEDSFSIIADYWNVYLSKKRIEDKITPYDVARMMTLLKIARSISNPMHQDNDIDICGYTAIAAELAYEEWVNKQKEDLK